MFSGTHSQLLASMYPGYDWLPWKFAKCPQNYWEDTKNQRKFMDWAGKELKVKEMSDWYNITLNVKYDRYFSENLGYTRNWWRRSTTTQI
jgi:hypothetical protein